MKSIQSILVRPRDERDLNGLGMMVLQYLEQNLADSKRKAQEGRRIRSCVSVEVEKGIAITVSFEGDKILIENGVAENPDLYLKGSTTSLSEVLIGKTGPLAALLRGRVKLNAFPKHPIQSLRIIRFLKMPPELLIEPLPPQIKNYFFWILGAVLGLGGISLLIRFLVKWSKL